MALNTTIGSASAEAYRPIADHKTYCTNRGLTYPADTVLEQQARFAMDYLNATYGHRWAGYRVNNTQALDWPRAYAPKPVAAIPSTYSSYPAFYLDTELPTALCDAQSELMIRVAAGELSPDLTRGILREKTGPIETEYDPNSSQTPRYPAVDGLLRLLLKTGSSTVSLVRA